MVNFGVGDTVTVQTKNLADEKTSVYDFTGTVIAFKGKEENRTFTVRRIGAGNVGIERIFPLASPNIVKIEVKKKGRARRAKLYYLRDQAKAVKKILRRAKKRKAT